MLAQNPILVNERMEIIDGQHRLEAAKSLRVPVWFLVVDAAGLEEVQQLNSYTKAWTSYDYLESYCALKKPAYLKIRGFVNDYKLPIEASFALMYGDTGSKMYSRFKKGTLEINEEQYNLGVTLANAIDRLKPYFVDGGTRRVFLYYAIREINKQGYLDMLLEKVEASNAKLTLQHSTRDYLRMFEDSLNWHNRSNKDIRLF